MSLVDYWLVDHAGVFWQSGWTGQVAAWNSVLGGTRKVEPPREFQAETIFWHNWLSGVDV